MLLAGDWQFLGEEIKLIPAQPPILGTIATGRTTGLFVTKLSVTFSHMFTGSYSRSSAQFSRSLYQSADMLGNVSEECS